MRFVLHKVLASQVTDNFKRGQRYVVNYKLPEQPVQVINERVSQVTHSDVLFETQTIPKDSILNVCFLLSLPSELLRLAVSFLDPATQCAIAPTSSLIRNSVNEQQSSPNNIISLEQRRLNARNFINTFALPIESNILSCRLNSISHAIRCVEHHLCTVEPTILPFVFLRLLTSSTPWIRDIMNGFIQRQKDPVIKCIQDIEADVLMAARESDGYAVLTMESCLKDIELSLLPHVRERLRFCYPTLRRIEQQLSQREQDPIALHSQNIDDFVLREIKYYSESEAVGSLERYLNCKVPADMRDAVLQRLREGYFYFQRIEQQLSQREQYPVIRYAQDIEAHICRSFHDYTPIAVESLIDFLFKTPVDIRTSVREVLRSSRYPLVRQIERRLTQLENNPIFQHAQDIEAFMFRCSCHSDSNSAAVKSMESLLRDLPDEIRSSVREALRSSEFHLVRDIEGLLTQRENNPVIQYAQDIELSMYSFVTKSDHDAIEGFKELLQKTPVDIRTSVREALRSSEFPRIQWIERLLTEKETALAIQNATPSLPMDSTHLGS